MMKAKQMKSVLILALFSLLIGCKSAEKKQNTGVETTAYQALAQKWGEGVKYDFNKDRSYVLAQSELSDKTGTSFSYFVFDMKAEKTTLQGTIESGYIKWLTDLEVEIFRTPGKMAPNTTRDDYTEVVNVQTGKSTPKATWKK